MSECVVIACGKPAGDGFVCRPCLGKLERMLAEVPALFSELDIAIAKESRFAASGDKVTQKGGFKPVPFDVTAADAKSDLESKLSLWAADLAASVGARGVGERAGLLPAWAAWWLLAQVERIRTFAAADDLTDELFSARATAVYCIDRPMERRYLGECAYQHVDEDGTTYEPCGATLWGRDGEDELTCKDCGTFYLAAILEQKITDMASKGLEDRIYTATEAAEVICALRLGEDNAPRLVDRIGKWSQRGRLTRKIDLEKNGHKRPGYRLGDILKLVNDAHESDTKRRSA